MEVTLRSPLLYDHRGVGNASFLGSSRPFMAAEVALLSTADNRYLNVVIQGMEGDHGALSTEQFGIWLCVWPCV